ncbi:MAG TPA: hypothetical protein VGR38_00575, partial [Candidatus Polarisedimenticolia bacterium]|nr:hypothetical protein [Candidatus Polarisedimenticolia bacterium]
MSRISFFRKHVPAIIVVLFGVWAMPSGAFAEIIGFEVLEWQQSLNGTVRVDDGSLSGTDADLQEDLGLDEKDYLTQERLWLHVKRHSILGAHLESNRTGRETLSSPLVFGGMAFAPGDTVKSRLELRQDSLLYRYDFIDVPMFKLGIPFGAERLHFKSRVESTISGLSADASDGGTFPVAGLG